MEITGVFEEMAMEFREICWDEANSLECSEKAKAVSIIKLMARREGGTLGGYMNSIRVHRCSFYMQDTL